MTEASYAEMLIALLLDMEPAPTDLPIDLSELGPGEKLDLLIGCAAELIAACICARAENRDDAMLGLRALTVDIMRKIQEGPYGYQRQN